MTFRWFLNSTRIAIRALDRTDFILKRNTSDCIPCRSFHWAAHGRSIVDFDCWIYFLTFLKAICNFPLIVCDHQKTISDYDTQLSLYRQAFSLSHYRNSHMCVGLLKNPWFSKLDLKPTCPGFKFHLSWTYHKYLTCISL